METVCRELSIERLAADLLRLLESKSYSPRTIENYRRTLSRISMFMEDRGIAEYSASVGELFLAQDLKEKAVSDSYQRYTKTVLRRLGDVCIGIGYELSMRSPEPSTVFVNPKVQKKVTKKYSGSITVRNLIYNMKRRGGNA